LEVGISSVSNNTFVDIFLILKVSGKTHNKKQVLYIALIPQQYGFITEAKNNA